MTRPASPRIDPRLLRDLLAIARHGSLVRAAKALNLTQPALSVSLSRLEDVVGVQLVTRGRNGAVLTGAGRVLLRHAESIENSLSRAREELALYKRAIAGPLTIGGTPLATPSIIAATVARLLEEFGDVAIDVDEDTDENLLDRLRRMEIDLFISTARDGREGDGIERMPLFEARSVLVMRSGHPLAGLPAVSLRDLSTAVWVMPRAGGALRRQIEGLFHVHGVPFPTRLIEAAPFGVIKAIVQRSDAISILSDQFLHAEIVDGTLAAVPLVEPIAPRRFQLHRLAGRGLSPLGERFVEIAREIAANLQR